VLISVFVMFTMGFTVAAAAFSVGFCVFGVGNYVLLVVYGVFAISVGA